MQAIAAETTARLRGGAAACDGGLGGGQNYASTVWSEVVLLQKVQVDLSRVVKVVRGVCRPPTPCPLPPVPTPRPSPLAARAC